MKINIKRIDDNFNMEATNDTGNSIVMDGSTDIGGAGKGMRPMQLLLAAVGGCSAIDVILILKKQKQIIESFEIEVDGEREKIEGYSLFRDICLHYKIKGKVDLDKAERAVKLSVEKYCSVSKTLEPTAKITYKISIN
ncbi:MAG: OsmC family protein [Bacteroidota bacterium]|nr:OsmC family protein [Bacteroidota bacterium]MDP3146626.1 OsmC family protein [Bacteroidota bacterium]MDP3556199.1 OsmC family protein [Bacteroidota bacterium]